jgi:putative ABC transport system ATP-binding protein
LNQELNITLLMVTHDRDAAAVASRQIQLAEGQLREQQEPHPVD